MLIPKHKIEEVVAAAAGQLPEIIGDHLQIKKSGASWVADCPYCQGQKKFTISNKFATFKCFKCGKAGNAVAFMMEIKGKSFPDAIKALAEKLNILL